MVGCVFTKIFCWLGCDAERGAGSLARLFQVESCIGSGRGLSCAVVRIALVWKDCKVWLLVGLSLLQALLVAEYTPLAVVRTAFAGCT